jgi:hypothetical protein
MRPFGDGVEYVAVFDIETQDRIRRTSGSTRADQIALLQVSCASVLCIRSDLALDPTRAEEALEGAVMKTYWRDHDGETSLGRMVEALEHAELLVCYNGLGFDFPVLKKYYRSVEQYNTHTNKTHDIFLRVREVLGWWPKLDALLNANGLALKTADGLEAIKMWEEGRREELQTYCESDTRQCARLGLRETIRIPGGGHASNHTAGIASALASMRHSNLLHAYASRT